MKLEKTYKAPKGVRRRFVIEAEIEKKDNVSPFLDIDLKECLTYTSLTLGISENTYQGKVVSFGRIHYMTNHWYPELLEMYPELKELGDIEKRWHLNELRAGTRKQEEVMRGIECDYSKACEVLKLAGKHIDRGYVYGEQVFETAIYGKLAVILRKPL